MAAVERYSRPARLLHWAVALLVAALFGLGLVMTRGTLSIERLFTAYQWHKAIGVVVWMMMLVRVGVRVFSPPPSPPDHMTISMAQQRMARGVHVALYVFLLMLPVTGWLMVSASPLAFPIALFGVEVPLLSALQALPETDRSRWFDLLTLLHSVLAFTLLALVVLHIGGAFSHGAQLRRRMGLWLRSRDA